MHIYVYMYTYVYIYIYTYIYIYVYVCIWCRVCTCTSDFPSRVDSSASRTLASADISRRHSGRVINSGRNSRESARYCFTIQIDWRADFWEISPEPSARFANERAALRWRSRLRYMPFGWFIIFCSCDIILIILNLSTKPVTSLSRMRRYHFRWREESGTYMYIYIFIHIK